MTIVGDPLTGALPRTRLIVPQTVMGPTRTEWPHTPDPQPVPPTTIRPGRHAYIRSRFGVRRYTIRTVNRSYQPGPNRGRTYITATSRRGWTHTFWADRIVSTR